ncbi:hypothetical protein V6N13_091788 [Hibiscus sabdariffa]|uniref:Uncharacterized protein n=1 Tax=Hibiscus sabdariffa TaxID=183260 RepID=A0ABR2QEX5_9ROSI
MMKLYEEPKGIGKILSFEVANCLCPVRALHLPLPVGKSFCLEINTTPLPEKLFAEIIKRTSLYVPY